MQRLDWQDHAWEHTFLWRTLRVVTPFPARTALLAAAIHRPPAWRLSVSNLEGQVDSAIVLHCNAAQAREAIEGCAVVPLIGRSRT